MVPSDTPTYVFITCGRDMDNESMLNDGEHDFAAGGVEQKIKAVGDGRGVVGEGSDDSENKQGGEDDEEDLEATVRRQAERYCGFVCLESYYSTVRTRQRVCVCVYLCLSTR